MATFALFAAAQDGTWTNQSAASTAPHSLVLSTNGTSLAGSIDGNPIQRGGFSGTAFWFSATRNGVDYTYKGTVNGSQLTLSEYQVRATTYTFTKSVS